MERKVVFFDIDGTLLNSQKEILESTRRAISKLKTNGILPVIATGRPPFMFEWVREELNIPHYVSINGQYVVVDGNVVYENTIEKEALQQLALDAESKENYMAFYNHETYKVNHGYHPDIKISFDSFQMGFPGLDKEFHLHAPVHQAILFCTSEKEEYYKTAYPGFDFIRWHPLATDVLPKGSSKLVGIMEVLKTLNVDIKNSYAFGDGLNDFEMIKYVGNGIMMGNGHYVLKEVANYVTGSCDEDGIYKGLEYYKLLD
jgi:Cof subfamily protein (haloacid dehalogenase superfamily)